MEEYTYVEGSYCIRTLLRTSPAKPRYGVSWSTQGGKTHTVESDHGVTPDEICVVENHPGDGKDYILVSMLNEVNVYRADGPLASCIPRSNVSSITYHRFHNLLDLGVVHSSKFVRPTFYSFCPERPLKVMVDDYSNLPSVWPYIPSKISYEGLVQTFVPTSDTDLYYSVGNYVNTRLRLWIT